MRASNSTASFQTWNSPLPYLFGGLGLMSLLIATALVILACSYHKRHDHDDRPSDDKSASHNALILPLDPERRIVVIMAGDDLPSFLAMPADVPSEAAKTAAPPHALACDCDQKV
ncbi:hypothetical protein SAY87_019668 [Trapa incisa]|uniref:Uncharacterized protein n=1 Tax=Trapa incisa TaxID=236973 RepID=A0AAN7K2R9_9MYRT|nr:hypothetical protein SAY87_019668 [Trapa incisa]